MIRFLSKSCYLVFLAMLSVVAGVVLPVTLAFGAFALWDHDYLKGGALLCFTLFGLYITQFAFDVRKKIGRNRDEPAPDRPGQD
ncbi:hypothetical protein JMK10_13270 [Rhodovulum sulfidophilum]|uniref:hypothetical protein n=1 Tax=Rhodovulum sulfidophilum TaxID=35806 RepID=UPI00192380B4|nr:hypothetical protein [Rhodovulum sulfidophilum]MBL3575881.1 hypothetical protein [Rhodovulum sulfidophilum]MCE8432689.1 hypothetical protein [Rhodovulum sulfidophilum]MCF4117758.1 hypothetical protein [Rhodovulum sulfidophilum]